MQREALVLRAFLIAEVFVTDFAAFERLTEKLNVKILRPHFAIQKTFHNALVWSLLKFQHAENTNLHHKRFCNPHRLHHHGEGEKAHLASAKKRGALGVAFLQ